MNDVPLKQCTKCARWLPATTEYFSIRRDRGDILHTQCRECIAARDRKHYAENIDREREVGRNWRNNNRDKVKIYNKTQRIKNPMLDTIRGRAWYAAHRQEQLEEKRRQYADNPDPAKERRRQYAQQYPDKVRESAKATRAKYADKTRLRGRIIMHRYRARKRNLPHTFTRKDWVYCLEFWGNCCAYCGRPAGLWHTLAQDHFIPLSKGGAYTPDNIIPACHGIDGCNNSKSDNDPKEWLENRFGKRKAKAILFRIANYFETIKRR